MTYGALCFVRYNMGTTFPTHWSGQDVAIEFIAGLARGGLESVRDQFRRDTAAGSNWMYRFVPEDNALVGVTRNTETGEWDDYELPYEDFLVGLLNRAAGDIVRDFVGSARVQPSLDGVRHQLAWRERRLRSAMSAAESLSEGCGRRLLVKTIGRLLRRLRERATTFDASLAGETEGVKEADASNASDPSPPVSSVPAYGDSEGWLRLVDRALSVSDGDGRTRFSREEVAWTLRRWTMHRERSPRVGVTQMYGDFEASALDDDEAVFVRAPGTGPGWPDSSFPSRKTVRRWILNAGLRWEKTT